MESQGFFILVSSQEKKKGRPGRLLDINTLGGRIRHERESRDLNTETTGAYIGVTNQQISFAEQALEKIPTGSYKIGEKEKKGYSDQLVFALSHELGTHFDEPEIRQHLDGWLKRMAEVWDLTPREDPPPSSVINLEQLQAALFDDTALKAISDEELDSFLRVIRDAHNHIQKVLEERKRVRKKGKKR